MRLVQLNESDEGHQGRPERAPLGMGERCVSAAVAVVLGVTAAWLSWVAHTFPLNRGHWLGLIAETVVYEFILAVGLFALVLMCATVRGVPLSGLLAAAMQTGDRDAIIRGCQVLATMGPAAGNIVPLVWEYLMHDDGAIRVNAGSAISHCCQDKRMLVEARALLVADTGDGLYDAGIRVVLRRMEKGIAGEGDAGAAGKDKLEQSGFS